MADLQLAVAVKPGSKVKQPVCLGNLPMSMQGWPSTGSTTGSSTDFPATPRVAWPMVDLLCSDTGDSLDRGAAPGGRARRGEAAIIAWRGNANGRPGAAVAVQRAGVAPAAGSLLRVALAELVHAAAGVHQLLLTRVERVRRRGNLDLDQRVLVAVLPLHRLLAGEGRAGEDLEVGGHVLEHDVTVLGMDIGLHGGRRVCCGKPDMIAGTGPAGQAASAPIHRVSSG